MIRSSANKLIFKTNPLVKNGNITETIKIYKIALRFFTKKIEEPKMELCMCKK